MKPFAHNFEAWQICLYGLDKSALKLKVVFFLCLFLNKFYKAMTVKVCILFVTTHVKKRGILIKTILWTKKYRKIGILGNYGDFEHSFFSTFWSITSKINIFKNRLHFQSTFLKAVILRYQT